MILSGLVPVVLAILIGIPLLSRLRGDYFALGTLGMGQIIQNSLHQGRLFYRRRRRAPSPSDGLHVHEPVLLDGPYPRHPLDCPCLFHDPVEDRTGPPGHQGRRDLRGVPRRPCAQIQDLRFCRRRFSCGLCGSLYGIYLFHINPDSVIKLDWTLYPILMCVIGGAGSVLGPVIGALFMTAVFNADRHLLRGDFTDPRRDTHRYRDGVHARRPRRLGRKAGFHMEEKDGLRPALTPTSCKNLIHFFGSRVVSHYFVLFDRKYALGRSLDLEPCRKRGALIQGRGMERH